MYERDLARRLCCHSQVSHYIYKSAFDVNFNACDWSRCNLALRACEAFHSRVPHDVQAAKMSDVWPIENLWGILNMRVKAREPLTKEDLRRIIEEEWCKIDDDKDLCRRLMRSIPKRLQVNSKF